MEHDLQIFLEFFDNFLEFFKAIFHDLAMQISLKNVLKFCKNGQK